MNWNHITVLYGKQANSGDSNLMPSSPYIHVNEILLKTKEKPN